MITSPPPARAESTRNAAAAQLLTTIAASAPVTSAIRPSTYSPRRPRPPASRSYSTVQYPEASTSAAWARSDNGARPRLVWMITPVALITRLNRSCRRRTHISTARISARRARSCSAAFPVITSLRTESTARRANSVTRAWPASAMSERLKSERTNSSIDGKLRKVF